MTDVFTLSLSGEPFEMKTFNLPAILAIAVMGLCIGCAEPTTEPVAEAAEAVSTAPETAEMVAAAPAEPDTTGCASCKTEEKCDGCKEATATAAVACPSCKSEEKCAGCKEGDAAASTSECSDCKSEKKCDGCKKGEDS